MEKVDREAASISFTAFKEALKAEDLETVRRVMKAVDRGSQKCCTKFQYYDYFLDSISGGDFKTVKLMLRANVIQSYVKKFSKGCFTPFQLAVGINNKRIRWKTIKVLIEFGIKMGKDTSKACLDRYNQPYTAHEAVRQGDCELVKFVIENMGLPLDHLDSDGYAPIHEAIEHLQTESCIDMIKQLVKLGADVNIKTRHESTCFHLAFARKSGKFEVLKLLIGVGAELNPADTFGRNRCYHLGPSKYDGSPLSSAICYGDLEVIRLLIESGANVNTPNWESSALCSAVTDRTRNKAVIQLLLEYGADVNARGDDGDNILNRAASFMYLYGDDRDNYIAVLQMLLAQSKDKNPTENELFVPFKNILERGNLEGMHLFLDNGVQLKNCGVRFPLHGATHNCVRGHERMLEHLLESCLFDVDATDDDGKTALHKPRLDEPPKCRRLLIEWGANVNVHRVLLHNGKTVPLLLDVIHSHDYESADLILSAGAKVDYWDQIVNNEDGYGRSVRLVEYFTMHMVLLMSQGYHINVETENFLRNGQHKFFELVGECSSELEALKTATFCGTVTLYDVLVGKDITKYTKNSQVVEHFKSLNVRQRFPYYGNQIECRYSLACVRREVIDKAIKSLSKLLKLGFCHEILHRIVSNLPMKDLRRLCHVHAENTD